MTLRSRLTNRCRYIWCTTAHIYSYSRWQYRWYLQALSQVWSLTICLGFDASKSSGHDPFDLLIITVFRLRLLWVLLRQFLARNGAIRVSRDLAGILLAHSHRRGAPLLVWWQSRHVLHHRIQISDCLFVCIQLLRRNRTQSLTLISLANKIYQIDIVHLVAVLGTLLDRLWLLVRRLWYASGALLGILLTLAILDSGRLLLLGRMRNGVHIGLVAL